MKSKKITTYHNNGSVWSEEWWVDGRLHRADGPAWICYNEDGSVSYESWYVDGRRHRADGPAWIDYYDDGSVLSEAWHVDGRELTKDEHLAWRRKRIIDEITEED